MMSTHTFTTMGTVVSIRLAHTSDTDPRGHEVVNAIEAAFENYNGRFSLYLDHSEISLIASGELTLAAASTEMREAYARALEWRTRTHGDFTPHRPDGVLDLNGTIKAEAIAAAADVVRAHGFVDFSLNCGGDVLVSGSPESGKWITGIVDPGVNNTMLSAVAHTDGWCAVATSSTTERGEHIWSRPETAHEAIFRQVTVVASDIVTADVWATAIMAGGQRALDLAVATDTLAVLAVTRDGGLVGNENFRALVAR
jgi:thiamine biosynthesis lipoprotein